MRQVLAVAILDLRRLWLIVGAFGVFLGTFPGLSGVFGARTTAEATFPFVFGAAALVAGAAFGLDFGEAKPSFFFARPLSTPALFGGRIAALGSLSLVASLAFWASYWLSGLLSKPGPLPGVSRIDVLTAIVIWPIALFFALAAAAHTRQRSRISLGSMAVGTLRLAGALGATAIIIGLFSDLMMRVYNSPRPFQIVAGSYVLAGFISSCVAIELGRTNRLRITKILNLGLYIHTLLVFAAVIIAWWYLMHPGPDAIIRITSAFSSADGRSAYVSARVDRGDEAFNPGFRVDLGTGDTRRLDRGGVTWAREQVGLWHSRDGSVEAWIEQTPMLLRNARTFLTGSSLLQFQTTFGEARPLPQPEAMTIAFDWELQPYLPVDVLPAANADLFAVRWSERQAGSELAFVSPSKGQLSALPLGKNRQFLMAWAFRPSGQLRAAVVRRADRVDELRFVDIEPATGAIKEVASAVAGAPGTFFQIRFDDGANRALVIAGPPVDTAVQLMNFEASPQPSGTTLASGMLAHLQAGFMADGRVAVIVRRPPQSELQIFSRKGERLLTIALSNGLATIGSEPFAGSIWVSTEYAGRLDVVILDTTSGKELRRLAGFRAPSERMFGRDDPFPPPGSPGSRILLSSDQKLFLLPSLAEEPRQLLPRQ